jgi:hypothetical protein
MSDDSKDGESKREAMVISPVINGQTMKEVRRNYIKQGGDWAEIFRELESRRRRGVCISMAAFASEKKIPPTTFRDRYRIWVRGGRSTAGTEDKRGQNRRRFTEDEEADIGREVRQDFISQRIPMIDEDMMVIGLRWGRYGPITCKTRPFAAGHSWVTRMKRKFGFGSGRPSINRRAVHPASEADKESFRIQCQKHLHRVGSDLFINMDETSWKLVNPPKLVWFYVGMFFFFFFVFLVARILVEL